MGSRKRNNQQRGKRQQRQKERRERHRRQRERLEALHLQFVHQDGLVVHVLSFLDVTSLVQNKQVCKKWQNLCTIAIDFKCASPKAFETRKELRNAVKHYCSNNASEVEIATRLYGYPINKWQVQKLEDFSGVFYNCYDFNEDISSWDVSNARDLCYVFYNA